MIRVEESYDAPERQFIDVKTTASERSVPIIKNLRSLLVAHRLASGRQAGLVFGRTSTLPFHGNTPRRIAYRAWAAAGLEPLGFHEARHTFVSLLIAAKVDIKAISVFVGHRSVSFTLYGHLMRGAAAQAAAEVNEYIDRHRWESTGAGGEIE